MRSLKRIFFWCLLHSKIILSVKLNDFLKSDDSHQPFALLFGHPVGHSLSPRMHNRAADLHGLNWKYHAVDVEPGDLSTVPSLLNRDEFIGANVTLPYKTDFMSIVDELDRSVDTVGALNTIVKQNYKLIGYNTDVYGFQYPLEEFADLIEGRRAIVFGTGGASRAIVAALNNLYIEEIVMISRSPNRAEPFFDRNNITMAGYSAWTAYAEDAALIVNATPLGMHPNVEKSPVRAEEQKFLEDSICYDIVYRPLQTRFLRQAEEAGAEIIQGLDMFIQQGRKAFELWTDQSFPVKEIRRDLIDVLSSKN